MAQVRESSADDVVSRLQAIGLNLYESRAYYALLGGAQLSAKQVGQIALIPQSRTYDILETLAAKGFALATPSVPKLYTAVPFDTVLPSQYRKMKAEIQMLASKVQNEAQEKLDQLTGAYGRLMEDLRSVSRTYQAAAEPVWVVEGRDNIERTIVSLIQGAKKDVMRITKPPDLRGNYPLDPFYVWTNNWKFLKDAIGRGVRIRWLSLIRELPSFPGLGVTEPPERRYLERDDEIIEKFFLADDTRVLLNLYDPKLSAFGSMSLLMYSEVACSVFREHFDAMWDRAKPLEQVLPQVRAKVKEACERMIELGYPKAEVTVYKVVAEMGACSDEDVVWALRKKKLRETEVAGACTRLTGKGFVRRNKILKVIMAENPSNVIALLGEEKIERSGLTT